MQARRAVENPIVVPSSVVASRDDLEVIGVFNPAVVMRGDETCLMLRVAEAPRGVDAGEVAAVLYDAARGALEVRRWRRDTPGLDASDPRVVSVDGQTFLTSMSHLRMARSRDGVHFEVDPRPALSPAHELESFGIEDGRLVWLEGRYVLNYSAVSQHGIATGIAVSDDLVRWQRMGIGFAPNNRDVTIFPERIGDRFAALHRPMPDAIGSAAIWYATSPDLLHWGDHRFVAGRRRGAWDDLKIGGGAVPFRVDAAGKRGWLAIYHGVRGAPLTYALGALLLDPRDPSQVLARSREPILSPQTPYETNGFFGNVVFTCGAAVVGDDVRVYYGAADGVTAVADLAIEGILAGLA